jgi:hypothetical protein
MSRGEDSSSRMRRTCTPAARALSQLLTAVVLGLSAAVDAANAQSIAVGPNVWVSSAMPGAGHYEVTLAADPADPRHLLAGSMIWRAEKGTFHTAAYTSTDGGASWKQTHYVNGGLDTQDPAVAYGPNHRAYFISWGNDDNWDIRTLLATSRDDARSWLPPAEITTLDREFITVDDTRGKYRGRIYVNGRDNDRLYDSDSSVSSIWVLRFDSLQRPLEPKHFISMGNREITIPTNGVVTANGSYITGFVEHDNPVGSPADSVLAAPNATLKIIKSADGGSRFGRAVVVAPMYDKFGEINVSSIPWLAADVSPNSRFAGRVYAVWADRRSGRSEIWFARSEDGGDHWSAPVRVSDDAPRPGGGGPDDFHPLVAVNNSGSVGVMWYDRRDNPDNTGWWVRFAASIDGGHSFSSSALVSEAPFDLARDTQPVISGVTRGGGHPHPLLAGGPLRSDVVYSHFNFVGGHTAGLASSPDGLFHLLWVDDRTGVSQIYTSAVRVRAGVQRQSLAVSPASAAGAASTDSTTRIASVAVAGDSALENISQAVTLELSHARYVPRDSLVVVSVVLRNTSRDTLRGPFELHIRSVKSDLGSIGEARAARSVRGHPSRVILLAPSGAAALPPGGTLSPQSLEFRLKHPPHRITAAGGEGPLVGYGVTLVSLESDVFGRSSSAHSPRR